MRSITVAILVTLGLSSAACGDKASPEAVKAACRANMTKPFVKSFEARMKADANWAKLTEQERDKLREEAMAEFDKELETPEARKIMENCEKAYSNLSPEQLECLQKGDSSDRAHIDKCLKG